MKTSLSILTITVLALLTIVSLSLAGNVKEIGYDDGVSDLWVSPWSTSPGSEIAVRFSANPYPVKIERIKVYIPKSPMATTPFAIKVYSINSNTNSPGVRIDSWNIGGQAKTGGEWVDLNVSDLELIVNKDFFVSVCWTTAPGADGKSAQYIGLDKTNPIENRAFWKYGSTGNWKQCPSDKSCYGDPMIRVVVSSLNAQMPAEVNSELFIHIPSAIYTSPSGTVDLWADFEYAGTDSEGYHIWRLKGYGPNSN